MQLTDKDIARFWSKVDRRGPNECWLWMAAIGTNGYGKFWAGNTTITAHRAAFFIFNEGIPNGLHVLHKCDVRRCCNPSHLWSGTTQENTADRHFKNRSARGEGQAGARLTDKQVAYIRSNYCRYTRNGGRNLSFFAKEFDVHISTIAYVVNRKHWNHVKESEMQEHLRRA